MPSENIPVAPLKMHEAEVMEGGLQFTWGEEDRNSILLECLKTRNYFTDVTLVSTDQKEFFCHKVVLSACSKFFQDIFSRRHHQQNLVLFLAGVSSKDLENIINFIYEGLVKVSMDDVDAFVTSANILGIKGITEFKVDDVIFDKDKKEKKKRGRKKKVHQMVPDTGIDLSEPLTQVEVLVEPSTEDNTSKSKELSEELSDYDFSRKDDVENNASTMQPNKFEISSNNSTTKSNKEKLKEVESKFSREEILKAYKMMKLMKQNKIVKSEEDDTKNVSQ